jgi:hypothetical protein
VRTGELWNLQNISFGLMTKRDYGARAHSARTAALWCCEYISISSLPALVLSRPAGCRWIYRNCGTIVSPGQGDKKERRATHTAAGIEQASKRGGGRQSKFNPSLTMQCVRRLAAATSAMPPLKMLLAFLFSWSALTHTHKTQRARGHRALKLP